MSRSLQRQGATKNKTRSSDFPPPPITLFGEQSLLNRTPWRMETMTPPTVENGNNDPAPQPWRHTNLPSVLKCDSLTMTAIRGDKIALFEWKLRVIFFSPLLLWNDHCQICWSVLSSYEWPDQSAHNGRFLHQFSAHWNSSICWFPHRHCHSGGETWLSPPSQCALPAPGFEKKPLSDKKETVKQKGEQAKHCTWLRLKMNEEFDQAPCCQYILPTG